MPWEEFPDFIRIRQDITSGSIARRIASEEPEEISEMISTFDRRIVS